MKDNIDRAIDQLVENAGQLVYCALAVYGDGWQVDTKFSVRLNSWQAGSAAFRTCLAYSIAEKEDAVNLVATSVDQQSFDSNPDNQDIVEHFAEAVVRNTEKLTLTVEEDIRFFTPDRELYKKLLRHMRTDSQDDIGVTLKSWGV